MLEKYHKSHPEFSVEFQSAPGFESVPGAAADTERNRQVLMEKYLLNFRVHLALKAYQELLQTLSATDKSL